MAPFLIFYGIAVLLFFCCFAVFAGALNENEEKSVQLRWK